MQKTIHDSAPALVAADGHVHFYPVYDLRAAFHCLIQNLDHLATAACPEQSRRAGLVQPATTGNGILKLAFLAEAEGHDFFSRLKNQEASVLGNGLEVIGASSALCVTVSLPGAGRVTLVAGRQIATRERLEVLGLAMSGKIPDGLPLDEVIRQVASSGGVPVLAWAPGKWLFSRGKLVRGLIEGEHARNLCLGDTTLRPLFWSEPSLMRLARARGLKIIPGSDALPFAGEERYLGTYGFVYRGPFDAERPVASIRQILTGPGTITPVGERCSPWVVAWRLKRLREARRST